MYETIGKNGVSTVEAQLTALITLLLAKESHELGLINDEEYKSMLVNFSNDMHNIAKQLAV